MRGNFACWRFELAFPWSGLDLWYVYLRSLLAASHQALPIRLEAGRRRPATENLSHQGNNRVSSYRTIW